jgi:hypothetical protein
MDINLSQPVSLKNADGTRNQAGTILGLDSISVGGALGKGAAALAWLTKTAGPILDKLNAVLPTLATKDDIAQLRTAIEAIPGIDLAGVDALNTKVDALGLDVKDLRALLPGE